MKCRSGVNFCGWTLKGFLKYLGFSIKTPISMFSDGQVAIHVFNLVDHEKTRLTEMECHLIREKIT